MKIYITAIDDDHNLYVHIWGQDKDQVFNLCKNITNWSAVPEKVKQAVQEASVAVGDIMSVNFTDYEKLQLVKGHYVKI